MIRKAILVGVLAVIALFAFMIYDGWFMKGDTDVECLPYAECESVDQAE